MPSFRHAGCLLGFGAITATCAHVRRTPHGGREHVRAYSRPRGALGAVVVCADPAERYTKQLLAWRLLLLLLLLLLSYFCCCLLPPPRILPVTLPRIFPIRQLYADRSDGLSRMKTFSLLSVSRYHPQRCAKLRRASRNVSLSGLCD